MALDYIKKHYETELKPASELFDKDGAESAISAAGGYLMHESYLLR